MKWFRLIAYDCISINKWNLVDHIEPSPKMHTPYLWIWSITYECISINKWNDFDQSHMNVYQSINETNSMNHIEPSQKMHTPYLWMYVSWGMKWIWLINLYKYTPRHILFGEKMCTFRVFGKNNAHSICMNVCEFMNGINLTNQHLQKHDPPYDIRKKKCTLHLWKKNSHSVFGKKKHSICVNVCELMNEMNLTIQHIQIHAPPYPFRGKKMHTPCL